jgi:CubicO group peptidase (beta-lactamase class C family)
MKVIHEGDQGGIDAMTQEYANQTADEPRQRISRRRALAAASAALAAAGSLAHRSDSVLAAQATPVPAAAPGEVTAARVAQAVEQIPTLAADILKRSGVPGMAVAVVYDDTVQFVGGFGVRELGKDAPIDADTVFQLASVSKSLAATVVSSVVGTGEVTWEGRLADIDPGFALHEAWPTQEVSLADLFAHRSGLRDHGGDLLEDLGFDRDTILHRLRFLEPEYSFREGYAYTNFGLTAAAEAAAHAAGSTWEDLSDDRLYKPLAMTSTSSRFADYMARQNRAIPHVKRDGKWQVTPLQRDPDPESPAGGASSNVTDLVSWMRLQLGQGTFAGQELIPAAALAPMHTPQAVSNVPANPATQRAGFYGLGANVSYTQFGMPQWSHSGAFNLGAGTAYYLLPAAGFGIVALTNGSPVGAPEAVALTVLDIVRGVADVPDWFAIIGPDIAAIVGPTYGVGSDWTTAPAAATSALAHEAYTGIYQNDFYGDVAVAASGDGLVLRIGPKPLEFPLTHFDRDTFTWQPIGENAYGLSGLTFTIEDDDQASGFSDQYLASGGAGNLARKQEA